MITNISTKTTGLFYIFEDETGQRYQVDEGLTLGGGSYAERLEAVPENWDLVEGYSDGTSLSKEASPDEVFMVTSFVLVNGQYAARIENGMTIPLTPTELKTIMNAKDIHNAKVRGVEPPAG